VIRLRDGGLIGYVQATLVPEGRAWVAYELASAAWGRGYASEATGAMLTESTARYEVSEFAAVLRRDNARSRRLLERLGFVPAEIDLPAGRQREPGEIVMRRPASPEGTRVRRAVGPS
jgi:RimJ/RimL family protein N-acetyltransferase